MLSEGRTVDGANVRQIEDDAQVNQVSEDELSDIRSPDMEDITSPASQGSQAKVWGSSTYN